MSLLIITALDDSGTALVGADVVVNLCDINGTPLREFTSTGLLVQAVTGVTNSSGVLQIDLPPNSQVLRDNTYYSVKVANRPPVLILKSAVTQTLFEALAAAPVALGPGATLGSLGDVDLTGLTAGQGIRFMGGMWVPFAWPSGGGGGTDKPWVNHTTSAGLTSSDSANRHKCDASGGAITLTLPTAVGNNGIEFVFKRTNSMANNVTIATSVGQTIDGASTLVLTMQWQSVNISSDNANWMVT